ncbi:MAG TPA: hypothetical protein VE988_03810 [Gemmataceae bacterium]|nr:hypothetical protein [Gemmataceae bacterium]
MSDAIVEEVRRVREDLIKSFGGIKGYFQHCQAQDRASAGRRKQRKLKQTLRASRKKPQAQEA